VRDALRSLGWLVPVTLVVLVFVALPAHAQAYVSGLSVSDANPAPGSQITVRAAGLQPNRPAPVAVDDIPLASPTADANGVATQDVTIPATLPAGEHLLVVEQGSGAARHTAYSRSIDVETGHVDFSRHDGRSTPVLIATVVLTAAFGGWLLIRRRPRTSA
jgi:hypothetical protein